MPDLAFATACVTLFYCLFLFQGYQKLFRDSDAGWHIRTGEAILTTGNLPRTDPYSFTRGGQPWFAWEWLADVAMGGIHRAFGLKGVASVLCRRDLRRSLALVPPSLGPGRQFSDCLRDGSPAALHLQYSLAGAPSRAELDLPAAGRFPAQAKPPRGRLGDRALGQRPRQFLLRAGDRLAVRPGRPLVSQGGSRGGARPLLNPYGPQLYVHVFRYLTDTDLLSRIGEFQSFDFHSAGAAQILVTVILGVVGGTLALTQRRLHHFASPS